MFYRFIRGVTVSVLHSFFVAEYYSTVWRDHILLIHSCVMDDIFGTVTVCLALTSVLTTAL